mgnify:CR=1 FL=1
MNKNNVDMSRVKSLVRKALRQQSVNKIHLLWVNVFGIKQGYKDCYEQSGSTLRLFMPPVFLIILCIHLLGIIFDCVWCALSSVFPGIDVKVLREDRDKIAFQSGMVEVYVVVSEDGKHYNYACDIDHVDDLWDGHHD